MQFQFPRALQDFRRTWSQLLITQLLSVAMTVVVATPLIGLLLQLFLLNTEDNVLTDTDIASFFLHPLGIAALLLLTCLGLGVKLAQVGLVMVIGFGAVEDRRVTYLDALRYVFRQPARFFHLAGKITGRVLLLAAPFLAVIAAIYLLFLGDHDINYYLAARPSEFRSAVALAGIVLAVLTVLLLRMVAAWILALPLLLFTDVPAALALRRSSELVAPQRWRIARFLATWFGATFLVSAIATFLLARLAGLLVPGFDSSWALVAVGLAVTLAFSALVQFGITLLSNSLLPLLMVRWFRDLAGPGRLQPEIGEPGSLDARGAARIPGSALLGGMALLSIVLMGGAYAVARGIDSEEQPAIIAHRGASAAAPENTMAAFELAAEDGADWIELDVQENAEGIVIVAHDSDFMKQARSGMKVWESSQEDLKEIDIGSWYGPEFADQRVRTLHEVLDWAKDRIGVVIELKYYGHDDNLEARVAAIVEATGMQQQVMVMSLARPGLNKFAELRPDWKRGLLNTASLGDLTQVDVNFLALNAAAATRQRIRAAHARGIKVYVWTVNDPVQMSVLLSRGADGLITDEPARAREVLELRKHLSPFGQFLVWVAGETGLLEVDDRVSVEADA